MISMQLRNNGCVITLSPGWIVLITWIKEHGFSPRILRDMVYKDKDFFLHHLQVMVSIWDEEFEKYTHDCGITQHDLSSYLLTSLDERSN